MAFTLWHNQMSAGIHRSQPLLEALLCCIMNDATELDWLLGVFLLLSKVQHFTSSYDPTGVTR